MNQDTSFINTSRILPAHKYFWKRISHPVDFAYIKVQSSQLIDVFIFDESNYIKFMAKEPSTAICRANDINTKERILDLHLRSTWYFVIGNNSSKDAYVACQLKPLYTH